MTDTSSTRPQMGEEEILTAVKMRLREHWLTSIHCDHERKTDRASCSCSVWRGEEKPSIAAAVQDWIEHAMPVFASLPQPTAGSTGVKVCPDGREFLRELAETMGVIDVCADESESIPIKEVMAKMLVAAREYRNSLETPASTPAQSVLVEASRDVLNMLDATSDKDGFSEVRLNADPVRRLREYLSHVPSQPAED